MVYFLEIGKILLVSQIHNDVCSSLSLINLLSVRLPQKHPKLSAASAITEPELKATRPHLVSIGFLGGALPLRPATKSETEEIKSKGNPL